MYISEDAPFLFSGFESTIPNFQIANIGVLISAFDVLCTKPVSGMQITGITGNSFVSPSIEDDITSRKFQTADPLGAIGTFGFESSVVL